MLGGLAAPQTSLLNRWASPPGPPALNFVKHDAQITPRQCLNDLLFIPKSSLNHPQMMSNVTAPPESPENLQIKFKNLKKYCKMVNWVYTQGN